MTPKELVVALEELHDELVKYGLTDLWRVRKKLMFSIVRSYTIQLDYEKAKAKNPKIRIEFLENDEPWTDEDKTDIASAVLVRRSIMKRAAELNKKEKEESKKRKQPA